MFKAEGELRKRGYAWFTLSPQHAIGYVKDNDYYAPQVKQCLIKFEKEGYSDFSKDMKNCVDELLIKKK